MSARPTGNAGGLMSRNGSGAPCVRTTAPVETPGTICPTITRGAALIAGARMASPGISDRHQYICFALALWNGKDPILKERLFGLTGNEGNHGEDVKEYYFYLDSTPTHSYMKFLYKYPHAEFPYARLVEENRRRGKLDLEFELIDTGIFDDNRYFDVFVEYAKAGPDDILILIEAVNRGPEPAQLHLLPTVWFRNTWSWGLDERRPKLRRDLSAEVAAIKLDHYYYGSRWLYCEGSPEFLFTENETNNSKLFNTENDLPYVKDGINDYIVHGVKTAVNPEAAGTKAAAHYTATVAAGKFSYHQAAADSGFPLQPPSSRWGIRRDLRSATG